MNDTASSHVKSLAVSLSGGGHRATLFVLGALMYLADAKANAHVTSIASVSGGSLTNGFVGQTVNFREIDGSEFRKRVAGPLATQIAKSGTLFAPLFTKVYLLMVYDNMGDQWARGFAARIKRCPNLGPRRTPPNQLVVVNASARIPWIPFRQQLIPLIGELAALMRVNNILYINTTNMRRQEIVASFDPTNPLTASALPGALVQISQSPSAVASAFAHGTTPVAERARRVLDFLAKGPTSDEWAGIARENSAVATTLSKLGTEVSARLIYQGYVVTMCNLQVLFGTDFPLLPDALAIERFRELIG